MIRNKLNTPHSFGGGGLLLNNHTNKSQKTRQCLDFCDFFVS